MKQGSDEWHAARATCSITGSAAGKILGHSPYGNIDDALREKVRDINGAPKEFIGNKFTQWGEDHEAIARDKYELETGNLVDEIGFVRHPDYDWIGYSPDGVSNGHLIEIKCPYSRRIPTEIPAHYMDQVQLGMEVLRLKACDFIYWTPDLFKVFHVERDPTWFAMHLPALEDFNEKVMLGLDDPIHLEDKVKDRSASKDWESAVAGYNLATQTLEMAKKDLEMWRKLIINLSDGVSSQGCGLKATHVTTKGSVQYKSIPELKGVDLEQYRSDSRESWRITKEKS